MRRLTGVIALGLLAGCGGGTPAPQAAPTLSAEQREGWQMLWDGRTLTGWEPRGAPVWTVEDGTLTMASGGGTGYLATTRNYGDYRLRAEFWTAEATGNGGFFIRAPETGNISVPPAIEINISDNHRTFPTGSITNFAKIATTPQTVGRWATMEVTARGNRVTVLLDGQQVADAQTTGSPPTGRIAIQSLGASVIRYRNIRILPL